MKKVVIFPHAGAVRSGYQNLEREWKKEADVVFISYEKLYKQYEVNDFKALIQCLREHLKEETGEVREPVIFFGHSMGAYILYALSDFLGNQYAVEKFVYSDVRPATAYRSLGLKDMEKHKQDIILETKYDFPEEIRAIVPLYDYFKGRLLEDLLILDTMPLYPFQIPSVNRNTNTLFLYSDYAAHDGLLAEWQQSLPGAVGLQSHYFKGNHYYYEDYTTQIITLANV